MNKRDVQKAVAAIQKLVDEMNKDDIDNLREQLEEHTYDLSEKIDRLECMENLGDKLQERLESYNAKMEHIEEVVAELETITDSIEALENLISNLEETIN